MVSDCGACEFWGYAMNLETVAIDMLVFDPANARKHSEKNIEAIKGSLARFGQQKPIVVTTGGVVIAGNGTLEAARSLGWTEIKIVRTSLTGADLTAYGIADNRSGELAEWDMDVLGSHLQALREDGLDLKEIGFDIGDLEGLKPFEPNLPDEKTSEEEKKYVVQVICSDEDEQQELFNELRDRGLRVKV